MKDRNKIRTTYPVRKIPFVPNAIRDMPFSPRPVKSSYQLRLEDERKARTSRNETPPKCVTVVVGAQYGSEGKGKTVSLLARDLCGVVVRCGGPNSGHTIRDHHEKWCLRMLPSGLFYGQMGFIAPAAVLDLGVLQGEIQRYHIAPYQLSIDRSSAIIDADMVDREQDLVGLISSTGSGTGAAAADKALRKACLVGDLPKTSWVWPYVKNVREELNRLADEGSRIVVEGTQGFGLSLHHSGMYPHVTSKDTTASQFIMEAGLSPLLVKDVVMVVRTFPIRVSGRNAGHLKGETTWGAIRKNAGYTTDLTEFTSVTKKVRRVANFDMALVQDACMANRPTRLVVHGLDYLGCHNYGVTGQEDLNTKAKDFISKLEDATGVQVMYGFTGPSNEHVVRFN